MNEINNVVLRFKQIIDESGLSFTELEKKSQISKSSLQRYASGTTKKIPIDAITAVCNALNKSAAWVMGWDNDSLSAPTISDDNVEFAVIGDVAAGFDKVAIEDWTGDKILIPSSYLKGRKRDDFFVLRVKGDSMYPEYRDGDKLLILKQNAVDYSGQIAVAIYDDELGTIKKIEYKKDSIHLVPINPQYQPEIIKGTDIEKVHILGIPKLLIREIEDE